MLWLAVLPGCGGSEGGSPYSSSAADGVDSQDGQDSQDGSEDPTETGSAEQDDGPLLDMDDGGIRRRHLGQLHERGVFGRQLADRQRRSPRLSAARRSGG
ncbi:MAG TPA: hypothetical protein VK034_02060, partial [Enhygromyxa sp.]|nr:hypothetical protein [Enhygromyxa sp.]